MHKTIYSFDKNEGEDKKSTITEKEDNKALELWKYLDKELQ